MNVTTLLSQFFFGFVVTLRNGHRYRRFDRLIVVSVVPRSLLVQSFMYNCKFYCPHHWLQHAAREVCESSYFPLFGSMV